MVNEEDFFIDHNYPCSAIILVFSDDLRLSLHRAVSQRVRDHETFVCRRVRDLIVMRDIELM